MCVYKRETVPVKVKSPYQQVPIFLENSQFTDICEVDKGGLLGPHSDHLRGFHHQFLLLSPDHTGVLLLHDVEHPLQKLDDHTKQGVRADVQNQLNNPNQVCAARAIADHHKAKIYA